MASLWRRHCTKQKTFFVNAIFVYICSKRCHSKSSQVHVHFPDLMRFYFFTPKVSDRLRCDSLGNSYEKRHNEFTLTSINPWTSIPLNLLLTIIYVFTSYYPRSSTETREGYNLTLPCVVFRGTYIYSSYYWRFLTKMQGGYHNTLYLIAQ